MSPDRPLSCSEWHPGAAGSHRTIWVIIQLSSSVTDFKQCRSNQPGARLWLNSARGRGSGTRSWNRDPRLITEIFAPGRASLHHKHTRKCKGRRGHRRLACCVPLPWRTSLGPMKTDDRNNNMRYNHQGQLPYTCLCSNSPHPPVWTNPSNIAILPACFKTFGPTFWMWLTDLVWVGTFSDFRHHFIPGITSSVCYPHILTCKLLKVFHGPQRKCITLKKYVRVFTLSNDRYCH